jgi:hypothetical protein
VGTGCGGWRDRGKALQAPRSCFRSKIRCSCVLKIRVDTLLSALSTAAVEVPMETLRMSQRGLSSSNSTRAAPSYTTGASFVPPPGRPTVASVCWSVSRTQGDARPFQKCYACVPWLPSRPLGPLSTSALQPCADGRSACRGGVAFGLAVACIHMKLLAPLLTRSPSAEPLAPFLV